MPAALKITGLVKDYPKGRSPWDAIRHPFARPRERVLDGLDIEVREGALCALLGPNGAGKSTLLRIITGIVAPTHGTVEVFGAPQNILGQRLHEKVGLVVGDERSFYVRLTAAQNLAFFAAMHGLFGRAQDDRVRRALNLLELSPQADKPFSDLSGGMKQRLALARGLLADPQVLLFDEITRGLDVGQAGRFRRLVRERLVGEMKKTIVFATHNIEEVREVADHVILICKGRLAAQGTLDEVTPQFETVFAPDSGGGDGEGAAW